MEKQLPLNCGPLAKIRKNSLRTTAVLYSYNR